MLVGCAAPETGAAACRAGDACTLVGTGAAGFNGEGLPATESDLYLPSAVRTRGDGTLFVMDWNNHRLRMVGEGGLLSTFAGNGEHGLAAAGAVATESALENPVDFAFDADGTVLLVSSHDPRVLRLRDGRVQVVAGAFEDGDFGDGLPLEAARFQMLSGIVSAADGTVFVSDELAHRVRALRPGQDTRTVAGIGRDGFSSTERDAGQVPLRAPRGLALDEEGNLYIAESGNHVIRRVTPSGTTDVVAGTGEPGFSPDGAHAPSARIDSPSSVAALGGEIYFSDSENNLVRRITREGKLETVAGTREGKLGADGAAWKTALHGPAGLALTGDSLFVADQLNHVVRVVRLR